MATINIVLSGVTTYATRGGVQPVIDADKLAVHTLTSSGTSQQANITAPNTTAGQGLFWQVTAMGGNVYVDFGTSPTAVVGQCFLVLDGQTRDFGGQPGQKIAVINA